MVEAGKRYIFVNCKNCGAQIAIAEAPAPELAEGGQMTARHGLAQVHCGQCGTDAAYRLGEFSIHQAN